MPRTKVVRKPVKEETDVKDIIQVKKAQALNDFRAIAAKKIEEKEKHLAELMKEVDLEIFCFLGSLTEDEKNTTIGKLRAQVSIHQSKFEEYTKNKSVNKTQDAIISRSKRRSLSCSNDDGYLTGESCSNSSKRTTRTSRTRTQNITKTTRRTRSVSRNNNPPSSFLKTPLNQMNTNRTAYGTVTPKMKPNTPQVLLRRPKQGEVAISMQGSPLLVNNVVSDDTANINIPLENGSVLSIQPQRGLRISQLPEFDENTSRQLKALRDNLDQVCARYMK